MRTRGLKLLLLLGLFAGGCMKSARHELAYPGTDDMATAAAPPAPEPMRDEELAGRERRISADRGDASGGAMPVDAPALVAPTSPVTTSKPAPEGAEKGEQAIADDNRGKDIGGRLIIYTAGMRISVFNLDEAMAKAEALPEKYGGYVFSMSAGALVLKIPARKLRAAMNELGEYGVVEDKSLVSQDVSAEYTDIESRIKALEATHKQLIELLGKARTVDEALHVRQALDQVAAELEVLKGRMRQLDSLISFSTLTVALYERGPFTPTPTSNDPFPWVDSLGVEATEWK